MTGQYLSTTRGVEPPTPGPSPIHDQSYQGQGFGYFSYFLNPTTRLSLITGSAVNHFQIPANPDQPQAFALSGVPVYPSAGVNENQNEQENEVEDTTTTTEAPEVEQQRNDDHQGDRVGTDGSHDGERSGDSGGDRSGPDRGDG